MNKFLVFMCFIGIFFLSACTNNDCKKDDVLSFLETSDTYLNDIVSDIDVAKAYPNKLLEIRIDMLSIQSEYKYLENPPCTENYQSYVVDFMNSWIDYVSAGANSPIEPQLREYTMEKLQFFLDERDRLKELIGYGE